MALKRPILSMRDILWTSGRILAKFASILPNLHSYINGTGHSSYFIGFPEKKKKKLKQVEDVDGTGLILLDIEMVCFEQGVTILFGTRMTPNSI